MECQESGKECLIYLDFNAKIPTEILKNKMFIRLTDLETENPLVQVNDMVFKGTYEHSIGTNIFLKSRQGQDVGYSPFTSHDNESLNVLGIQTRTINCKQMKLPSRKAKVPENNECIKYNFNWDYQELLKKFEDGTLDLKDMIEEGPIKVSNETFEKKDPVEKPVPQDKVELQAVGANANDAGTEQEGSQAIMKTEIPGKTIKEKELQSAYEYLQILSRTPVKRDAQLEIVDCDPKYSKSLDYKNIECKILEPPIFSYLHNHEKLVKENISSYVDIDRCIKQGLLEPTTTFPRTLTEEEERAVVKIENFGNLDLEARLTALGIYMEELQRQLDLNNEEENSKKDEFGRSPLETLEIFKKLINSLQNRIQERISAYSIEE